jgi:Fanconi anemia group J protein
MCRCRSLSNVARSVLLTSGTLSPLDSFSGELGLDFHVKLEAPHVVDINRQVGTPGTHTHVQF